MSDGDSGGSPSKNRRRLLQTMGAAGAAGLAGCSGGGGDGGATATPKDGGDGGDGGGKTTKGEWPDLSGKEVHVVTDETNPAFEKFFNEVAGAFETATGASTRIEILAGGGSVEERLAQLIQARDPPEVTLTGAGQVSRFVNTDIAGDVTPAVEYAMDLYGELPETSRVQKNGKDFILPEWGNIGQMWFREDQFDEKPDTWDKLESQCKSYDGDLNATWVATGTGFCNDLHFISYLFSNGGAVCGRGSDGKVKVVMDQGKNKDRAVETLEFLKRLHEYSPTTTDWACGDMSDALPNRTTASSWYVGARPKLKSIRRDRPFAKGVTPVGQPTNRKEETVALIEGFVSFKDANLKAANEFMKFMMQEKYVMDLMFATPMHNLPLYKGMTQSEKFKQRLDQLPAEWTQEQIQNALDVAQTAKPLLAETQPANPYTGSIYGSRVFSKMQYDTIVKGKDAGSVVDKYADQIRETLKKVQG